MAAEPDVLEPAVKKPPVSRASDTVYVGCKLPNGVILHLDVPEKYMEPVMGAGSREATRYRRLPTTYTLNGSAINRNLKDGDVPHLIIGGAGITSGVPRDFWEAWLKAHRNEPIVKNHIVFEAKDEMSIRARAVDLKDVKSGLEPLDPDNPGSVSPDLRRIQPGTRDAA